MKKLLERIERHIVKRRTWAELEKMTDRDLADIGIRRCDIRDLIQ